MTVLGLASLNKKLNALPKAAEVAIRAAMAQGADEIVALMKSLAPVESGDLRDSIGWNWRAAPSGTNVIATVQSSNGLSLVIYAGDDRAFYARMQEFGTKNMAANPYFFVSYRALRKRTKSRITRAITKSAKAVASGSSS